jgi:NAD(P)-dependent dehydrogenase (short-subunit alcohol dehydrogenase family)
LAYTIYKIIGFLQKNTNNTMTTNPFLLTNKTILVTGASSGIGRQTCLVLASLGANIVATARHPERLQATLDRLPSDPSRVQHTGIVADITQAADLQNLIEKCPPLHAIVHSAGAMKLLPFKFATQAALDNLMQINVYAPFFLTQQIIKQRKIIQGGSVVFVGSISGNVVGTAGHSLYATTKASLAGLTKVLAIELAPQKIRVNALLAGMVRSEMTEKMLKNLTEEQLIADEKRYPLGYGTPDDVGNALAFLVSDGSRWLTGTNLVLDGGFSAV